MKVLFGYKTQVVLACVVALGAAACFGTGEFMLGLVVISSLSSFDFDDEE